jgi:predicted CXXCH cytochrome family protein
MVLMAIVSASWGAELKDAGKQGCKFSAYLENADNRARYEAMIARGRYRYTPMNNHENATVAFVLAKSGYGAEQGKNLDSFSAGCLVCHDGKSASQVRLSIINSPNKRDAMKKISTKHPIGMDYEKYSASNKALKSLDEMSQNLSLTEGRVSCITCHDPLNSGQNHLRITKTGIDLCSACHNT